MIKKFLTTGHAQNIPFSTTLNSELRCSEQINMIRITQNIKNEYKHLIVQDHFSNKILTEDTSVIRNKLNTEFNNLLPTLFPHTRYRGINNLSDKDYNIVLNLKKGDIVQDMGFGYFSNNKNIAMDFAEGNRPIFIKCKIPIWSRVSRMILPILQFQEGIFQIKSGETMTPAGSYFKVLKNKIDKKGVVNLVIKYLK